jgi:hypothetical protein
MPRRSSSFGGDADVGSPTSASTEVEAAIGSGLVDADDLLASLGGAEEWDRTTRFARHAVTARKTIRGRRLTGVTNAVCSSNTGTKINGMCSINASVSLLVNLGMLPQSYALRPERVYEEYNEPLAELSNTVGIPINEHSDGVLLWGLNLLQDSAVFYELYESDPVSATFGDSGSVLMARFLLRRFKNGRTRFERLSHEQTAYDATRRKIQSASTTVFVVTNYRDPLRPERSLHGHLVERCGRDRLVWMGSVLDVLVFGALGHVVAMVPDGPDGVEIMDTNYPRVFHDVDEYRMKQSVYGATNVFRYE